MFYNHLRSKISKDSNKLEKSLMTLTFIQKTAHLNCSGVRTAECGFHKCLWSQHLAHICCSQKNFKPHAATLMHLLSFPYAACSQFKHLTCSLCFTVNKTKVYLCRFYSLLPVLVVYWYFYLLHDNHRNAALSTQPVTKNDYS